MQSVLIDASHHGTEAMTNYSAHTLLNLWVHLFNTYTWHIFLVANAFGK